MHDQVVLPQFEETVDHAGFEVFFSPAGGAAEFRAAEEFVVAQDDQPFADQPKSAMHPAHAKLHLFADGDVGFAQEFGEAVFLGFVMAGQKHPLVPRDDAGEFVQDFVPRSGEAFDGLDLQSASCLAGVGSERGKRDGRKARTRRERLFDGKQSPRMPQPLQVRLPGFPQLSQLDQPRPTPRGKGSEQRFVRCFLPVGFCRIDTIMGLTRAPTEGWSARLY